MEAIGLMKYRGARSLLQALLKFPKRQFTINELSREARIPFASAWRLVRLWEPAGLIETGRVGKSVTVRLRNSPYMRTLSRVLGVSSPQAFTAQRLKTLFRRDGRVQEAYLFGSVASGTETSASDIDIALAAKGGI